MTKRDELLIAALRELCGGDSWHDDKVQAIDELADHLEAEGMPVETAGEGSRVLEYEDDSAPPVQSAPPGRCGRISMPNPRWECFQELEKHAATWKALAKRYRESNLGHEENFEEAMKCYLETGRALDSARIELAELKDELSDLKRAAPVQDVTAAVKAERARCSAWAEMSWMADDEQVARGLLRRITTGKPNPLDKPAQPATVDVVRGGGERQLAAGVIVGHGTLVQCDTCKKERPVAFWRYPGSFSCCAGCAERSGVFATEAPQVGAGETKGTK